MFSYIINVRLFGSFSVLIWVMSASILLIGLIIAGFLYFDETVKILIRLIN